MQTQVSNFVIVGVRMALAIEMNWRLLKSTALGTNKSMRNGMEWLCIDVDVFLFLPQRLPQYSLLDSESSQQPFCCIWMSLKTHMEERPPLLLCIIPTKGTSFLFAIRCLLIFVHPCVLFCMLKALSIYVSKTTVDAQRFLGVVCLYG